MYFYDLMTLLHSDRPKFYGALAVLSVTGLKETIKFHAVYNSQIPQNSWSTQQVLKKKTTKFTLAKLKQKKNVLPKLYHIKNSKTTG